MQRLSAPTCPICDSRTRVVCTLYEQKTYMRSFCNRQCTI